MTDFTFEFNELQFTINNNIAYHCGNGIRAKNFTPLMYLVMNYKKIECDDKLHKFVLNHKADINKQNELGYTALMLCCSDNEKSGIVKLLLYAGADPNVKNNTGNTALIYACYYNNYTNMTDITKLLIDAGSDGNLKNEYGNNCLYYCHTHSTRCIDTIKLLVDFGLNLKLDCCKYSGFEYICKYMNEDLIKYCFNKHVCDEVNLIKCIRITKHKQLLTSYLADLYFKKVGYFKLY